jgi:hypothetical protein
VQEHQEQKMNKIPSVKKLDQNNSEKYLTTEKSLKELTNQPSE